MIVWISGPTGSGKSSFAQMLAGLGYCVIREVLDPGIFAAFVKNPARHCASLQEAIVRSRFEQWRNLRSVRAIAFDRSISEDVDVFCYMHYEAGLIDDSELLRLRCLGSDLQVSMPKPDLILYMAASRRTLATRVTLASHPRTIVNRLDRQMALYEEWLASRREDVLRLDNSACSLLGLRRLFSEGFSC